VNGSPHRQGQTPRSGGAASHRMHPAPARTCRTGAGLARVGVASVTPLDRTGSGPGGDGLDLDAGPQRQGTTTE
jgi:hypothetical protein